MRILEIAAQPCLPVPFGATASQIGQRALPPRFADPDQQPWEQESIMTCSPVYRARRPSPLQYASVIARLSNPGRSLNRATDARLVPDEFVQVLRLGQRVLAHDEVIEDDQVGPATRPRSGRRPRPVSGRTHRAYRRTMATSRSTCRHQTSSRLHRRREAGSGPARRIGATATARYVHASAAAASSAAGKESQPAQPIRSCAACVVLWQVIAPILCTGMRYSASRAHVGSERTPSSASHSRAGVSSRFIWNANQRCCPAG